MMLVHLTVNSMIMGIFTSTLLMLLLLLIRRDDKYFDKIYPSIFLLIYILCFVRMMIPLEFDGITWPLSGGLIWRCFHDLLSVRIFEHGNIKITVMHIMYAIWGSTALIKIYRYLKRYNQIHRLFWLYSEKIETNQSVNIKNNRFQKTKIVTTQFIDSPCCLGVFKRVIALPNIEYSEKDFVQIIRHESEHLNNNDLFIKLLVSILSRVYWWNPVALLLEKNINQNLEICCDMRVIKKYTNRGKIEYIESIMKEYKRSISKQSGSEIMLAMADGNPDELYERFRMMSSEREKKPLIYQLSTLLITFSIITISYFFVIQACYEPTEEDIGLYEGKVISLDSHNSFISKGKNGRYYIMYKDSVFKEPVVKQEIKESDLRYYLDCGIKER